MYGMWDCKMNYACLNIASNWPGLLYQKKFLLLVLKQNEVGGYVHNKILNNITFKVIYHDAKCHITLSNSVILSPILVILL